MMLVGWLLSLASQGVAQVAKDAGTGRLKRRCGSMGRSSRVTRLIAHADVLLRLGVWLRFYVSTSGM